MFLSSYQSINNSELQNITAYRLIFYMKATSVMKATISSLVSSDHSLVHLVVDHFAHTWASKQTKAIVLSYTSRNYQIQSSSPDNL